MTYKELKNRLNKCEYALKAIKDGTHKDISTIDVQKTTNQLNMIKESLQTQIKQLKEGNSKTYLVTPKKGQTTAVSLGDDEKDALKDADDVKAIKGIDGEEIKEGIEFTSDETKAIAKKVGQAVAKALKDSGDDIAHMKATNIEPNSFEIYVEYKNDSDDSFAFHLSKNKLHLADFSFTKALVDVSVKPSGEPIIHVDVLANELVKHFNSLRENKDLKEDPYQTTYIKVGRRDYKKAMSILDGNLDPTYVKMDIVDDDGDGNVIIYFNFRASDDGEPGENVEAFIYDAASDLQAQGIHVTGSSHDIDEGMDINDPVLMKMRASKSKLAKKKDIKPTSSKRSAILSKLKAKRAQVMRDMEQEAEPEGGPIADKYGDILNKIDAAIAKASGRKEMDYDTAVGKVDEYAIDPAEYGDIGAAYLKGFNKPHSLNLDQLETLGRKIVKQLYKGDFEAAKAKHLKEGSDDDFISKIRSAVQGPEVDAIFAAAQEEIDNGDAESMADALAIAADQYYEYYDSKGNEDGTEVAKYIMRSLPQSKSNVQDFSKLKDGDYKNWTVDEKMTGDDDLFTFGFDLDKIQHVIDHLKDNYSDQDYELHVGRGDTHPNAVTLNNPDMENDKELGNLLIAAEDQEETDYQVNRQMQEDEEEDAKNDADYEAGWHDDPRKDEGDETDDYGRPHVDPKGSRTYMDPEEMKPSNRFKKMTQKEDTDIGHQDDEPSMLSATARETAEYSAKLLKKLQAYDQHDGEVDFPNWWQSKLILAREYMSAAFHYLDSEEKQPALDQLALENKVNEGRGDLDQIVRVITDMANEDGTSTKEAALEIIDAIKDAYQIHEGEDTKVLKEYASRDFDEIFGALGYRQGFDEFIEDNPGAVEVLMDWIGSISEFRKKIGAEYSKEEQENLGFYYGDDDEDVYEEAELPKKFNSGKYSVDKLQKAHDVITGVMKDLAKKYKAGDKSVVSQLKDLTKQKKHVESLLDAKVSGTGKDQELDEAGPGFKHDCAAKVIHKEHGAGNTIPEKHTLVKEGNKYVVTHYDVLFENGNTVLDIPVNELKIESTNEHWHKGYKKKKK